MTDEIINRKVYQNLRDLFKDRAMNWNGVIQVWDNPSPNYQRLVPGWAGPAVAMNDTIPESERWKKYTSYTGKNNEIHETVSEENNKIHTLGNDNNIRRSLKNLRTKIGTYLVGSSRNYISYEVKYKEITKETPSSPQKEIYYGPYYTPMNNSVALSEIDAYSDMELTKYIGKLYKNFRIKTTYPQLSYITEWTGQTYNIVNENNYGDPYLTVENIGKYGNIIPTPPIGTLPHNTSYVVKDNDNYTLNGSKIESGDVLTKDITTVTDLKKDEDIVKQRDYKQLQLIINRIKDYLNTKNEWFSTSGICQRSCQIVCQSGCQISCQRCNTKQCHDQKCGTH